MNSDIKIKKRKQQQTKIWPKSNNSTINKNKNTDWNNKQKTKTTNQGGYRRDTVVYRYV